MCHIISYHLTHRGRDKLDAILHTAVSNILISIKIWMNFIPKDLINNITALVQIIAWHRPGDKPLSEPMTVSLLTHVWVTRPQWVNM